MRLTEEQKLEVLKYAREHGVINAAHAFGVGRRTIFTWNSIYNVYSVPKPKKYSKEQKLEMLEYARIHGQIATAEKYNIESSLLSAWNAKYNIYPFGGVISRHHAVGKRLTDAQQLNIVRDANEHGFEWAAKKYGLSCESVKYYARKWGDAPTRQYRTFNDTQRAQIIEFAIKNGITCAERKYAVNATLIRMWIEKRNKEK